MRTPDVVRLPGISPVTTLLLTTGLLLALASAASAGPVITFEFVNGTEKTAEVERVVDAGQEPYFVVQVGGTSANFFFHKLKPESVHKAWSAIADNDDPATHIAIGAYCSESGLNEQAVIELTKAREIAEKLERRARDMLASSRKDAAAALFREAKQQETLHDTDTALKLYARIWSYYHYDADDIRDEVKAAIQSLAAPAHAEEILARIVQARPAGNDGGNAGGNNGGNNGGANNPPVNPADELDDTSEFRSNQKSKYRRTTSQAGQISAALKHALSELAEARSLEARGDENRSANLYLRAQKQLFEQHDATRSLLNSIHADDWAWMPRLRRKISGTRGQIERELLAVSRARMHFYARRAPDHQFNASQAEKWCNSVLALNPEDDEALRVRMKLTELALQRDD